jgi:hypothetical protein
VSAPHKRDSVKAAPNYRPLTLLENISVGFERVIDDQLDKWIVNFTPPSQFGFLKGCGTSDYGAAVSLSVLKTLGSRKQGLLVSLDVKGAFDRVWWGRLKARLEANGMRGRALRLLKSYLYDRFVRVVVGGEESSIQQIFAGVLQGAMWSPKLWDFDISELPECLGDWAELLSYADDCSLWYEIDSANKAEVIAMVNRDLASLVAWGADNRTEFEPKKTAMVVISRKRVPFNPTGIIMDVHPIKQVGHIELVGFTIGSKLTWGLMIDDIAKKARKRIAALYRMSTSLDSGNLKLMYTSFIRYILEYGSVQWMGAAPSHLAKLDRVQAAAERIGGFKVESLVVRRETAVLALNFKLLDGKGRGILRNQTPTLMNNHTHSKCTRLASDSTGIQIKNSYSLVS